MKRSFSLGLFLTATLWGLGIPHALSAAEPAPQIEFAPVELTNPAQPSSVSAPDASVSELPGDVELLGGTGFSGQTAPTPETNASEEMPASEETEEEPALELNSIQDFWRLYEVSDSFRDRYQDGSDWQADDERLFLFYHLQERIRLERLESWALPDTALADLDPLEKPELNQRRFDAFWINGRLLSAEKTELEGDVAFRFHVQSFFTCRLELTDGRRVTLFCQSIPRALQKPGALDSKPKVGLIALFLKKGPKSESVPTSDGKELSQLFMLGSRLAWFPETILGNAGMDCGLFDDLDREELPEDAVRSAAADTRLTLRNRECFYQMMAAVNRMTPVQLQKLVEDVQQNAPEEYFERLNFPQPETKDGKKPVRFSSVIPLFNRPVRERGNFFYLKGIARRIVPIRVEDEDVNQRFGINHYYEIFIFPDETPESPVVVLVPELPPDVQPGSDLGYYVELALPCFFFNTWSYQKGENEEGKPIRRLSPLLIGGIPSRTTSTVQVVDQMWFYVLGMTVFGSLFLLSAVLYLLGSRDDQECARNRQKMFALPPGTRFEDQVQSIPEPKELGFEEWIQRNEEKQPNQEK